MSAEGFVIAVSAGTKGALSAIIRAGVPGARAAGYSSSFADDHLIEVAKNAFGVEGSKDWLEWPWRIELSPTKPDVTVDAQVVLARRIVSLVEAKGWRAVVGSNFEELL